MAAEAVEGIVRAVVQLKVVALVFHLAVDLEIETVLGHTGNKVNFMWTI